jgi:hypothetical protein
MNEKHDNKTETTPPQAQLLQMATAHWISHNVYVAAKLGLADHLADELAGEPASDTLH